MGGYLFPLSHPCCSLLVATPCSRDCEIDSCCFELDLFALLPAYLVRVSQYIGSLSTCHGNVVSTPFGSVVRPSVVLHLKGSSTVLHVAHCRSSPHDASTSILFAAIAQSPPVSTRYPAAQDRSNEHNGLDSERRGKHDMFKVRKVLCKVDQDDVAVSGSRSLTLQSRHNTAESVAE